MIQSNIINNDGVKSATIVLGEAYTVDSTHPEWDEILSIILKDDPDESDEQRLREILAPAEMIAKGFERLSDRVSVRDGHILFDNDKVDNELTEMILEIHQDTSSDRDFSLGCLVNFMEKVYTNPNDHSRDNLYRWMKNRSFSITEEGDLIAFKGVKSDRMSVNTGFAIVNGEEITGQIPNEDGSIIEMPRSRVDHNPASACSTGLHAGTLGYAGGFSELLIAVLINPRDVVSVPTDANDQKMRVCRYLVLGEYRDPNVPRYITRADLRRLHLVPNDNADDQDFETKMLIEDVSEDPKPVMTTPTPPTVTEVPKPTKSKVKKPLSVVDVKNLSSRGRTWVKAHAEELGGEKNDRNQWEFHCTKSQMKSRLKKLDALA